MSLWDFLGDYSYYYKKKKIEKTASYLDDLYTLLNDSNEDTKTLKPFTHFASKMDIVRYNQGLYDKLQDNGWNLDLVTGKFKKVLLHRKGG